MGLGLLLTEPTTITVEHMIGASSLLGKDHMIVIFETAVLYSAKGNDTHRKGIYSVGMAVCLK
jgi:hypothetical protein